MLNKLLEKIAKLPKIWSVILLVLFIVVLYVLLQKVIMPGVMAVVQSNFFFEKDEEQEELGKINNQRSDMAFNQCKHLILLSDGELIASCSTIILEALLQRVWPLFHVPESPFLPQLY